MEPQTPLRARLQSEFKNEDPEVNEQYRKFNEFVGTNPEVMVSALDTLIEGDELKEKVASAAGELAQKVLALTRNGARIGINSDKAWGEVFANRAHRNALDDLRTAQETGDEEKIAEKRHILGLTTLRAVAKTHLPDAA